MIPTGPTALKVSLSLAGRHRPMGFVNRALSTRPRFHVRLESEYEQGDKSFDWREHSLSQGRPSTY